MLKILCLFLFYTLSRCYTPQSVRNDEKSPTVVIAMLARNKAHTLPYFLTILDRLDYPKDRITLWIRSDHNSDNTIEIINTWLGSVKNDYHSIDSILDEDSSASYPDEIGPAHWPVSRFDNLIKLRENALQFGHYNWADYILFLDCDVFFTNYNVLRSLISKNLPIVAPMLKSDGLYSNFWGGMTDDYYYLRTDSYKPILNRETTGCFPMPMVHSCVLVNLKLSSSNSLSFMPEKVLNYDGPHDDIITFALSANRSGVPMHVCNDQIFGLVTVPLEQNDDFDMDRQQLVNIKLEVLTENDPLPVKGVLKKFVALPVKDNLGFDKIFMINLKRRPERRKRMMHCFDELGLQVELLDAVDGSALKNSTLDSINFMPGYSDPYHKRPMKLGEIGCFLSHYKIWEEMLTANYKNILILEDDIRFEPFFRAKVARLLYELNTVRDAKNWDLVYLGRKRMVRDERPDSTRGDEQQSTPEEDMEPWVTGSTMLVHAGYSYWTLGYALSSTGAAKLLDAKPLLNLIPVDEYLPILFDRHPRNDWKRWYPQRNLVALSVAPLLVYPTHYTGEDGYVSDTEDSTLISEDHSLHEDL